MFQGEGEVGNVVGYKRSEDLVVSLFRVNVEALRSSETTSSRYDPEDPNSVPRYDAHHSEVIILTGEISPSHSTP